MNSEAPHIFMNRPTATLSLRNAHEYNENINIIETENDSLHLRHFTAAPASHEAAIVNRWQLCNSERQVGNEMFSKEIQINKTIFFQLNQF